MASKRESTGITGRLRNMVLRRSEETGEEVVPFPPQPRSRESSPFSAPLLPSSPLPVRYEVRDSEGTKSLRCKEAPGLSVFLDRSSNYSEAEARKLGERVILLDGAGQFGPLLDNSRQLYNLDHHQGCVRAFTLATCEQALLLVIKGLDLEKGDWRIHANEPDLDTILALWILLNHRRLGDLRPAQRDLLLPLIRLEGAIDANGNDAAEWCGLPSGALETTRKRLDRLFAHEREVRSSGELTDDNLPEFTLHMLEEIDRLVYTSSDFSDFSSVEEEYTHVDVGGGHVAVVCRDGSGIYEVERRLKKLWGDALGVIALEKEPGHYTLRRAAPLADIDLEAAYRRLNLFDPRVDGRPPEKRWGGSDEIGGSPRPGGTGLDPQTIADVLQSAWRPPRPWHRVRRLATALLVTLGLTAGSVVAAVAWSALAPATLPFHTRASIQLVLVALVYALGCSLLTRRFSMRRVWLFGWRRPAGVDWLLPAIPALAAGAVGGVWTPGGAGGDPSTLLAVGGAIVLAAVAVEGCFRGLLHGILMLDFPIQTVAGRWFLSRPVLVTALLYALVTLFLAGRWIGGTPLPVEDPLIRSSILAVAAFVTGLSLGTMRERSLSLYPAILLHAAAGGLLVGLRVWLDA